MESVNIMAKRGPKGKYNRKLQEKADNYVKKFPETPSTRKKYQELPTIEGLAIVLNVAKITLYEWERAGNKKIAYVLSKIRKLQESYLKQLSLCGRYNPTIAKLLLSSDYGYTERSETKFGPSDRLAEIMQEIGEQQHVELPRQNTHKLPGMIKPTYCKTVALKTKTVDNKPKTPLSENNYNRNEIIVADGQEKENN